MSDPAERARAFALAVRETQEVRALAEKNADRRNRAIARALELEVALTPLAAACGVTRQTIYRWAEAGRHA